MFQFFVDDEQVIDNKEVHITGSDVNHMVHVLRMKPGERIRVSNRSGVGYFCQVVNLSETEVIAEVEEIDELGTELSNEIVLFQGLPKSDKMELIIQKATELGVSKIVPVAMKNCVVKLDAKKAEGKVKRWQAIAESAAKQSKRSVIPEVCMPVSYKEAMQMAEALEQVLVPYENERGMDATREIIGDIQKGQTIGIFVGPEGGFDNTEIAMLSDSMHRISLGRRILRTETAGLACLAMLVYVLDV